MNINPKNRNTIIIAGAALVFITVVVIMLVRMNRMEERYLQMLGQRSAAGGRGSDPYLRGPVKNTVLKHSQEILDCYREFLERGKSGKDKADSKSAKEGVVTLDWQVDDDGAVLSPSVVRSHFSDADFHACLKKKIASWRFPEPPLGMKKYVEHTFKFKDEKK